MSASPRLALVAPRAAQWVSKAEALNLTGLGDRWLACMAREGKIVSRLTGQRGINGKESREYFVPSLPIPEGSPAPGGLAIAASPASSLGPLFAGLPVSARVALPDPEAERQAAQRFQILAPILDFPENPGRYRQLALADGRKVTSLERIIEYAAAICQQSPRTLKRWLARYKSGGYPALADRIRADKGNSRWFARHKDAAVFAAYLHLVERTSVTFVREQLELEAANLQIEDTPSHETVRLFLANSISPAMKTLAREGERVYRERMAPYLMRGYVDVYSNQVWVGDHAIHDVEIQNDIFTEVPIGTPGRLRMSAFVDYRSRKAWATWAWEGSSRSIAATLLRGILQVGPPESIYVDNGKDYKKVAKGATAASELPFEPACDDDRKAPPAWWRNEYKSIEQTGLLARVGIAVTHCVPRHPQSKHAERFFKTMHARFDAVHSTYTSGSPATRPIATEEAMMRHRRLLKAGRVAESTHPTASRFILGCLSWIAEYNGTPQRGEGMDGRSPDEIFGSNPNPNQKPVPDAAALSLLMSDFTMRKVDACAIRLNRYRYTPRPSDRAAWAAMHEANETEVIVRYNATDPEWVAVLYRDGRLLAWLEAEALMRFAPNDPATQARIGESMEIRHGLEKATKQSLKAIAACARAKGARSAEELLYGRLNIPAAAGEVITQSKPRLAPDKDAVAPASAGDLARKFLEGLK